MKRFTLILLSLFILYSTYAQNLLRQADTEAMNRWADSIMNQLTPDERLGQLIMPIVECLDNEQYRQIVKRDIETYHVGGLIYSRGTMAAQAKMTQYGRELTKKAPLWIALDGEWGLSMRISDAIKYPRNGALGTIDPAIRDSILYQYGLETARQFRQMGISINFAPVLDVNSNPKNPVIGTRSFGNNVDDVVASALCYSRGLEDGGIMAVGKHFPGHGDTDTDSHKALPLLKHDKERMLSFECAPFEQYIQAGFGGIMIAHLEVPSLDSTVNLPSSLSKPIITDLLKDQFGFKGLIFTDGLAMKGVNNIPDYSVKALLAGIDILLDPVPLKSQWNSLKAAINDGRLPQELIDEKCRKVLCWKYALCIGRESELQSKGLSERVNTPEAKQLLTLMTQEIEKAKLKPVTETKPAPEPADPTMEVDPTMQLMPNDSNVVKAIEADTIQHQPQIQNPKFHSIDSLVQDALDKGAFPGCQILVAHKGKIIYNRAFGWLDTDRTEPNSLETVYDLASVSKAAATIPALMLAYDEYDLKFSDLMSKYIPQMRGTDKANLTIRQALLHETDIRDGFPFFNMTFDTCSYDKVYYSNRELEPFTVRQDKRCWFHKDLRFNPEWITKEPDQEHTLQIAEGLYLKGCFKDSIVQKIINLPLRRPHRYRYSCLNFILLRQLIENVTHEKLDQYLYRKMPEFFGNGKLCFNPLQHGIPAARIAPTEYDKALRKQHLRGYVHDEAAAWSGGVEGNAGLFGSATQLYPVLQMFLDKGQYNDTRYVNEITVERMTTQKSHISRRGLGFDKPEFDPKLRAKRNPCADVCSPATYGHTGYTGTCFWIDPQKELIYIFLCNRINPYRWNTILSEEDYRPRIQSLIYEAIK